MAKSRSIGGIYAELSLRDGKFKAGLKTARVALNQFGRSSAIAASAGIAGAMALAGKVIYDATQSASDFQEVLSKSNVVFGDSSADMQKWADGAADSMGMTKIQALEAASTLGTMFAAMKLGKAESSTMSKNMVGLASDLASFNNTSAEDAIFAISAAMRGESEPIRAYGVLLDDATLKAKALAMGNYEGKGTLEPQARAMAAYQVILEQTSTAQGDFARTSTGLANAQRVLKANIEDAKIAIGQGLLPAMIGAIGKMNEIDFQSFGEKLGIALSGLTDGSAWEIFRLEGEKAIAAIQASPAMNGFAANLNTVWDALNGDFESKDYYQAGLDANTEIVDDLQAKIDEIKAGLASKYEAGQAAAAARSFKPGISDPIEGLAAAALAAKPATAPERMQVNDYQRRGLSLDANGGGGIVSKQQETIDILKRSADLLKVIANSREKSPY